MMQNIKFVKHKLFWSTENNQIALYGCLMTVLSTPNIIGKEKIVYRQRLAPNQQTQLLERVSQHRSR